MIDYEKPLPLTPNNDQINTIKPFNRQKREERDVEIQASISPSLLNQISTSSATWMWKWNREIREGRCLNISICLISNSNAYKSEEHVLFIGYLGVTFDRNDRRLQ